MFDRGQFRMNIRSGRFRHVVAPFNRRSFIPHDANHVIKRSFARGRNRGLPRCRGLVRSALSSASAGPFTTPQAVCFSNGRSGSSCFQTIHHHSVDVARGLGLLFGISTTALPSWVSRTRWNNLKNGLAVRRTVGPSRLTDSSHPSSREGHLSTARWSSRFLLSFLDGPHATASSRVQRNSVPSTHMRCMTLPNTR